VIGLQSSRALQICESKIHQAMRELFCRGNVDAEGCSVTPGDDLDQLHKKGALPRFH
jgi:hypothetical protein